MARRLVGLVAPAATLHAFARSRLASARDLATLRDDARMMTGAWEKISQRIREELLQPDLARAARATAGMLVPLIFGAAGILSVPELFVVITAQNIAMVDVRGAYSLRFSLLVLMIAALAGSAWLGSISSGSMAAAIVAAAFGAVAVGAWRHFIPEYGPGFSITSTLFFLMALAMPAGRDHHVLEILLGGAWGLALQVGLWPVRPQHPLRHVVADTWLAASTLFAAMAPIDGEDAATRRNRVAAADADWRAVLDKAYATLTVARGARARPFIAQLEAINQAAARLVTRLGACETAAETLLAQREFSALAPSFWPTLKPFVNLARSVALAVASRQPSSLAKCEVRLRRASGLLRALAARIEAQTGGSLEGKQFAALLLQVDETLPGIAAALDATLGRAGERAGFSLELLDLDTWRLRPLASMFNPSLHVDRALVLFTLRIGVLLVAGVAAFRALELPHGYWLPFTLIVVLQPDYGATRQRAAQRVFGTLAGSVAGSLLLWLKMPVPALIAAAATTNFFFAYFLKRKYRVAVFFITLFVVLLTEAKEPVTIRFTVERLASTSVGGAVALLAAFAFWPTWERSRFPAIFAKALNANRDYVRLLARDLARGGTYTQELVHTKRAAELANSRTFASLQRMLAEPRNRRQGVEQLAALGNTNQRITRVCNVLLLQLARPAPPVTCQELMFFAGRAAAVLEAVEVIVAGAPGAASHMSDAAVALNALHLPFDDSPEDDLDPAAAHARNVFRHLGWAATELGAMAETALRWSDEDGGERGLAPLSAARSA